MKEDMWCVVGTIDTKNILTFGIQVSEKSKTPTRQLSSSIKFTDIRYWGAKSVREDCMRLQQGTSEMAESNTANHGFRKKTLKRGEILPSNVL